MPASCPRSSASCTSSTTAAPTRRRRRSSGATGWASGRCTMPSCSRRSPRDRARPSTRGSGWTELWQLLLVNQFHDILPGSSIGLVYEDTARDHAALLEGAEALARDALAARGRRGGLDAREHDRRRPRRGGRPPRAGRGRRVEAPAYGFGSVSPPPDAVTVTEDAEHIVLENRSLRAVLDRGGMLRSLVHLASGREALAGPGNVLQIYDDRPTNYDAWDVDPFHLETVRDCPPATSFAVTAGGGLRGEVTFEHGVGRASTRAPGCAPGRGLGPARVPLPGRMERAAHDAEGAVPGRGAGRRRHVRDAVRARRAARRTTPPATTWPATRCQATVSPICPSTDSGWRS